MLDVRREAARSSFSSAPLHAALLERFGGTLSRGLIERLTDAAARGEVRHDVTAADVVESIAGIAFMALLTLATAIDDTWVERTTTLIMRGISA